MSELLGVYHLRLVSDVLNRREEFRRRELWREGRKWLTTREAMERVFGNASRQDQVP